jgi:hypothetical protein
VVLPDGSEQLTGCGENCLNRLSFIHCDPRTCPCGQLCSNKPFHLLKAPQLDVFLTENRGHGVRMMQPLRKGNFVVEYAGEVRAAGLRWLAVVFSFLWQRVVLECVICACGELTSCCSRRAGCSSSEFVES